MDILLEDKRSELLNKSKNADNYAPSNQYNGKNRYERRLMSKVLNSTKEFNSIDMNQFFKEDILDVDVKVHGETDDYIVSIKFGGILRYIHNQLENNNEEVSVRIITRALINAFNDDNVYIHCQCADWTYRFSYWSRVNDISSRPNEEQTNNGKEIVNPHDTKGRGCKHTLLVLSNNTWINKVAAVIYNYINYMKKHYPKMYADIIYPSIYDKEYEDDVQLSLDDSDKLITDKDIIDTSNKWARTKTQFKPGQQSGVQFASDEKPMKQFDFDSLISDK